MATLPKTLVFAVLRAGNARSGALEARGSVRHDDVVSEVVSELCEEYMPGQRLLEPVTGPEARLSVALARGRRGAA